MKIFFNFKFMLISLLLAIGLSACDAPGPAETTGKKVDQTVNKVGDKITDSADKVEESINEQRNKTSVAISDSEITARVKNAIFGEPGLDTLQISVDTIKGMVTLSGSVDSRVHSNTAEALANNVSGVSQVINLLAIEPN